MYARLRAAVMARYTRWLDRRIPRAMLAVPRELFMPEAMRSVAYSEGTLRLGRGSHCLASVRSARPY